ncbi:uncharacterized protein LTR77_000656 [Saxophila tyrrhenica]|uniref:Mitochondrial inner membrane protease subunit n=1 Tax=Saxophila tyrrhenica TaxID=1690608 RepID=A0AAV9PNX9_9PEZI|nr:hypothetical protein LTR77_000656 [Saxophila tyrrhenica]
MRPFLNTLRRRPFYTTTLGAFWGATTIIFINDNVLVTTYVEGESMSPTLSRDYHETGHCDFILWNKLFSRSKLERGDVIQYMNPYKPEAFAVKRIIGLEGDTVVLDRRRRPEAGEGPEMRETRAWDAWKGKAMVPPGHVWVEGDNQLLRTCIDEFDRREGDCCCEPEQVLDQALGGLQKSDEGGAFGGKNEKLDERGTAG